VGWPAGFYLIKLVAATGGQWQVPFVVRSDSSAGRVALVLPLTTWQAYNDWGGLSLYHGPGGRSDFSGRSYAVSFDRPYPAPGAGEFLYSALPMVAAAERDGVPLLGCNYSRGGGALTCRMGRCLLPPLPRVGVAGQSDAARS